MYNLVSLKLCMHNHPSLPGCFSGMCIDTSTGLGGQNVLKTFEMSIPHNRRTLQMELESFLSMALFSLAFKIIFAPTPHDLPLLGLLRVASIRALLGTHICIHAQMDEQVEHIIPQFHGCDAFRTFGYKLTCISMELCDFLTNFNAFFSFIP